MLERDKYEPDHCLNHFPVASYDEFCRHIFGGITFKRLFLETEEFDMNATMRNNVIFSALLVSLLPIALHKRIYLFRNYQSKKARILFGLAWFFIPSNLLGAYFNQLNTRELTMKYQTNQEEFLKFLEIGDVNITNPKQQWAEF